MEPINLNRRERLAVQLKKLPEADRWRIFMMQQHMLVSHIETLEHLFDTKLAPIVRKPKERFGIRFGQRTETDIVLLFDTNENAAAFMVWLNEGLPFELPSAPSLRISVKTHKIEDLGHKVGK